MKKIIISSNSSWNIVNFRRYLIQDLSNDYEIHLLTPDKKYLESISSIKNIYSHKLYLKAKSKSFFNNIKTIISFFILCKKIKPDFFLAFTIKPNIFGLVAMFFFKVKIILNFTGMGSIFTNHKFKIYKKIIIFIFKFLQSKIHYLVVQNIYDYRYFAINKIIDKNKLHLIPGSGLDINKFKCANVISKKNKYTFLFLSRIKFEKGIDLYLNAIETFNKNKLFKADFIIAGPLESNEMHYEKIILNITKHNNNVIYLGNINDVKNLFNKIDIFVLPSNREGISRSLLEAMSMERLVIGSNKPGIKNVINNNNDGFIFKDYKPYSLYESFTKIYSLENEDIKKFTTNARHNIENNYRYDLVNSVYKKLIES